MNLITGIYGLAEGGNIRLQPHTASDLLVQETSTGERPKYQPPGHVDAPAPSSTSGGDGYQTVHDTGAITQTPGRTTTTTVERDNGRHHPGVDTGLEEEAYVMVGGKKVHESSWGTGADPREKTDYIPPKKKSNPLWTALKWIGTGALVIGTGGAALGLSGNKIVQAAQLINKVSKFSNTAVKGYNLAKGTNYTREELFTKLQNDAKTVKETRNAEQDLINSLPRGHPERIQLEELKKETLDDVPDRNGAIQETGTSITMDTEEVNDAKTQLLRKYQEMNDASRLAWQRQQQMNRDKQMAFYRMMMKPYFTGAAQGGRVPAGYNTGGLSNLFKLKNV